MSQDSSLCSSEVIYPELVAGIASFIAGLAVDWLVHGIFGEQEWDASSAFQPSLNGSLAAILASVAASFTRALMMFHYYTQRMKEAHAESEIKTCTQWMQMNFFRLAAREFAPFFTGLVTTFLLSGFLNPLDENAHGFEVLGRFSLVNFAGAAARTVIGFLFSWCILHAICGGYFGFCRLVDSGNQYKRLQNAIGEEDSPMAEGVQNLHCCFNC